MTRKSTEADAPPPRCTKCGQVVPEYYLTRGLCDDCKWDTWIPRGYQDRENYEHDAAWGHDNATRRPALGVRFLDHHLPPVGMVLLLARGRMRA